MMNNYAFLFLNPLLGFGGLEIQTLLRARDAIERGYKSLAIITKDSRSNEFARKLKLNIKTLNIAIKYIDVAAMMRLGKLLRQERIDIIIVPKTELLSIAITARNIYRKKASVILYQQMQSGINKKDYYHKWIYSHLDAAIVLTNKMKSELVQSTIFDEDRISVIPYGIESELYKGSKTLAELRASFNLPPNGFIVGNIARIESRKDQMTILKAFMESNIENSYLVFCGHIDDYKYYDNLNSIAYQNGLQNRIIYIPFTDNIPDLMRCFDVFVLATPAETFGLVIIEAMAAGVPVVAVNGGGIPEIITDRLNGLLFKSPNHLELANLINELSKNKSLALKIAESAVKTVRNKFEYKTQVDKYFDFCLKSHNQRGL